MKYPKQIISISTHFNVKDDLHCTRIHYGRVCKLLYEEVEELSAITSRLDPETLKELELIERREWAEEFNRVRQRDSF